MPFFSSVKTAVLDLLFPVLCFGCGTEGIIFCSDCRKKLWFIPPQCFVCRKLVPSAGRVVAGRTCLSCRKKSDIYAFLSPFSYDDPVIKDMIRAFKYQRVRSLSLVMADLLAEYGRKFNVSFPDKAILIPVPMYPGRERNRGFNQAELIAKELSLRLSLGMEAGVLQKIKKTKPQVELVGEERRNNIVGSMGIRNAEIIKEKIILLVDDVKTTGSTMEEAAKVLKEAGAKRVWAITAAH